MSGSRYYGIRMGAKYGIGFDLALVNTISNATNHSMSIGSEF